MAQEEPTFLSNSTQAVSIKNRLGTVDGPQTFEEASGVQDVASAHFAAGGEVL